MRWLLPLALVLACAPPSGQAPSEPAFDAPELSELKAKEYPVEDGATITVTFTNFCEQPTEYGFAPTAEDKPPIVWSIEPNHRREISVPKGYALRGRVAGGEWAAGGCPATRKREHLTFNAGCEACTVGTDDPLARENCEAAGAC